MADDRAFLLSGVVRIRHHQHRLLRNVNPPVDRIETVDHRLDLCRDAEIVHRRRKSHQVRIDNMFSDEFKIILEYAWAVHAAAVAADAGMHLFERRIEPDDFVSGLLRSFDEVFRQCVGIAVFPGAARDDQYFHFAVSYSSVGILHRCRGQQGAAEKRGSGGRRRYRQRCFEKFASVHIVTSFSFPGSAVSGPAVPVSGPWPASLVCISESAGF